MIQSTDAFVGLALLTQQWENEFKPLHLTILRKYRHLTHLKSLDLLGLADEEAKRRIKQTNLLESEVMILFHAQETLVWLRDLYSCITADFAEILRRKERLYLTQIERYKALCKELTADLVREKEEVMFWIEFARKRSGNESDS